MRNRSQRYAGGIIRRTQYGTWAADYHTNGDRVRQTHKTLDAAKDWLQRVHLETSLDIDPATTAEMADAAEARRILEGRTTLAEAARFWTASAGTLKPITVAAAVDAYLEEREADNLRPRSIQAWCQRLGILTRAYGDRLLHTITTADLRAIQTGAGTTRNNLRRYWSTFFVWASQRHHATTNPADGLSIASGDESLPRAISVAQARALLEAAATNDPALVPYIAVGLFAGLRTAELDRLTAAHIRDNRIYLDPTVTKLRDRRILDMLDPLPAWLAAHPPEGPLRLVNHRKRMDAIRTAADLQDWPPNAMRHSFATHHLAAFRDPARTAHYTRHSNQNTLHRHYIDLATHEDGIAYFALEPAQRPA